MSKSEKKKEPAQKPVEQQPAEQKPVEQKPVELEQPPAEQASLDPIADFERLHAEDIAWRVKAGLTRAQAIDVVREQIRLDAKNAVKNKEEK